MRRACVIQLRKGEQKMLERWARGRRVEARVVLRAKIVLAAAQGKENRQIAQEVGTNRMTAGLWRRRFSEGRLEAIRKDAPRGGRPATRRQALYARIVERTTKTRPKSATHWSVRTLSQAMKVSPSMVHRVWRASQLKPHLSRTFKVSNDPRFVEKVEDVVGLYLNPPEHALVLSVDEKSQIQALDRTQPTRPLIKGRCGTMTHDYKRHGTTTLFAALELAGGKVIGQCMNRHRHQEWIRFLQILDRSTRADLDLHLVVDNYATHKHEKVQRWLKRHPRFHMHFIPTSSSWLNLVERWFRDLTDKRIRRGVFRSVPELVEAITAYVDAHNGHPKPFVWTAKAERIIAKYRRAKAVLDKITTE